MKWMGLLFVAAIVLGCSTRGPVAAPHVFAMSGNQLTMSKGGPVIAPPPGDMAAFWDTDGTFKQIDPTGAVTAIGGGGGGGSSVATRGVSTANITLSGTQTVDGVALGVGDRELAAGQTDATTDGIYLVASGAWTRSTDTIASGMVVGVTQGTANAGTIFILKTQAPITVGSTALAFAQVSPPDFGPVTNVPLPNSNSVNVNGVTLTSTLSTATAGSEVGNFAVSGMSGGTPNTPFFNSTAAQSFFPIGTQSLPGIAFAGGSVANVSGLYMTGATGTPNLNVSLGGGATAMFLWTGGMTTSLYNVASTAFGLKLSSGGLNLQTYSSGDFQIGADGANATGATVGFIDLPTVAGTPTGVPADVRTGKASCEVDTTNFKICCNFAGTWKCTAAML